MADPIRIMHFRRTCDIMGGPETLIVALAKYIDRTAFDLTVVDFGATSDDRSRFLRQIEAHGIRTASIPASGKFDFRSIRYLAKLLDELRIDVLHTHDHRSDFIGYFATRRRPTPIAVTFWQPLRRYWWLRHIEILDEKLIYRFDRILPCSEAVCDEILAKRPDLADRTCTVQNAVDLDLFKADPQARSRVRAELEIPEDAFVCATIGRVMEDKGLTYLLDAQRRVADAGIEVRQLVVGIGPQLESLRKRVGKLGLMDRVNFIGHRTDIPAVLQACDLVVHSSLSEGQSVVLIEAMAAGRAVVATRVGGTEENVIHNETGLIVEPRDAPGLADGIIQLVNDPRRREAMEQRARELAFEKWSVERMARDFERVYREMLTERRARPDSTQGR